MRDHAREVDAAVDGQIQVVGNGMLADALDLFDSEGVRAYDGELLEVHGRPFPSSRCVHSGLDEGAVLGEKAYSDLQRLGARHGVVDDVDPTRVGDRQPGERRVQSPARPLGKLLHDHPSGFVGYDLCSAQVRDEPRLGLEPRHHGHLCLGMQGPQRRDRRRPQGAGSVDEGAASPRWRMADNGVHRDGEGVGEDRQLVGYLVRHRYEHRVVRGEQFCPGPRCIRRHPEV